MWTRRAFVKAGGIALFTAGAGPRFLTRAALAAPAPPAHRRRKVLVNLVHHVLVYLIARTPQYGGLFLEPIFRAFLVGFGLRHGRFGFDVLQQLRVGAVYELLVGLGVRARVFRSDVPGERVIGSDHGTAAFERSLAKQGEILAGLVNARHHE